MLSCEDLVVLPDFEFPITDHVVVFYRWYVIVFFLSFASAFVVLVIAVVELPFSSEFY